MFSQPTRLLVSEEVDAVGLDSRHVGVGDVPAAVQLRGVLGAHEPIGLAFGVREVDHGGLGRQVEDVLGRDGDVPRDEEAYADEAVLGAEQSGTGSAGAGIRDRPWHPCRCGEQWPWAP